CDPSTSTFPPTRCSRRQRSADRFPSRGGGVFQRAARARLYDRDGKVRLHGGFAPSGRLRLIVGREPLGLLAWAEAGGIVCDTVSGADVVLRLPKRVARTLRIVGCRMPGDASCKVTGTLSLIHVGRIDPETTEETRRATTTTFDFDLGGLAAFES